MVAVTAGLFVDVALHSVIWTIALAWMESDRGNHRFVSGHSNVRRGRT